MATTWLDRAYFPAYIAFIPDRKSWDKEIKALCKIYPDLMSKIQYPSGRGYCVLIEGNKDTILIWLDPQLKKKDALSVCVHECVHAFEFICQSMNEEKPSPEFAAYTTQAIFDQVWDAYLKNRRSDG